MMIVPALHPKHNAFMWTAAIVLLLWAYGMVVHLTRILTRSVCRM